MMTRIERPIRMDSVLRKFSQKGLAATLGVSRQLVGKWAHTLAEMPPVYAAVLRRQIPDWWHRPDFNLHAALASGAARRKKKGAKK